jgi:hypothetical protein
MWHQTLQQLPEGVQLIDLETKEVLFENKALGMIKERHSLYSTCDANDEIKVKKVSDFNGDDEPHPIISLT